MAGGVALATVPTIAAVAATQPLSVAGVGLELSALIIGASSTNPGGGGVADFYGGLFQQEPTAVANFLTGPPGIYQAIADNLGDDDTVVLSSGWGAANVSALLSYHKLTGDPVVSDPQLYVLDNNVARPNGGFGTRYPIFALIGVNPIPTPTDPGVEVLDVGYEYDINGNTPAYVLNPVAMANALASYADNRLNQAGVELPVNDDGELDLGDACDATCQGDIAAGQETTVHLDTGKTVVIKQVDDTTYIGYRTEGLPLLQPLRTYGGDLGRKIADVTEPALKAAVDYGYPDNDPLANPESYVPARLIPTGKETEKFVRDFTAGVQEGVEKLRGDEAPPTARQAKPSGTKPLLRTSLDFSPKARTSARTGTPKRPVAGVVKTTIDGLNALTKRLRGDKPSESEPAGDGAAGDA